MRTPNGAYALAYKYKKALNTNTSIEAKQSVFAVKVSDYKQLVKLRLNLTVVFSSVLAFLIASPSLVAWLDVLTLAIGGFLVTGASNALNQVLEKDYDKLMQRTADRPLAAGRMSISEGVVAAGFMSMIGITLLALFNPWTAFFGMLALVIYAFLYTPLKRVTPAAVTVGAIAGAMPVLIGSVAAQGELTVLELLLFTIQFLWQFPHFWSIGWLGHKDYLKAGYKFLPSKNDSPSRVIGTQSLLYALFLMVTSWIPYIVGITSIGATVLVFVVSTIYALQSWKFYVQFNRATALRLMFTSFFYIPLVLIILWVDKLL